MKHQRYKFLLVFILLVYAVHLNCSILLPTITSYKNAHTPPFTEITTLKLLNKIRVDDKVEITKKSGKVLYGSFIGVFRLDPFKYYSLYKKFKKNNPGIPIPDINDTIIVVKNYHNEKLHGVFLGFDFYQILMKIVSSEKITILKISDIKRIYFSNNNISQSEVIEFLRAKRSEIPVYTCVALKNNNIDYMVSLNEISSFKKINKKHSVVGNFIVGFLADGFVAFSLFTYMIASMAGNMN